MTENGDKQRQLVCSVVVEDAILHLGSKIDNLSLILHVIFRVPLSLSIIAVASYFFSFRQISEQVWLALLFVALFPFYGDAIRSLLGIVRPRSNGNGIGNGNNLGGQRGEIRQMLADSRRADISKDLVDPIDAVAEISRASILLASTVWAFFNITT